MEKEFKFNNLNKQDFINMDIEFDKNNVYSIHIFDNKKDVSHEIVFAFYTMTNHKVYKEIFLDELYDNMFYALSKYYKIKTNTDLDYLGPRYYINITNLTFMQNFFDPEHEINIYDNCIIYYYENGNYKILKNNI